MIISLLNSFKIIYITFLSLTGVLGKYESMGLKLLSYLFNVSPIGHSNFELLTHPEE